MSVYAGTTPSSGRRAGRAAARVTSHGAARSSGRRSRTKKNQHMLNSSSLSASDQYQYHGKNQHQHNHHPLQRNARSWTLLDTPLGGAGLIVPMWVPVDTLTAEQKEQYALKQKMKEEQEKQQQEGSNDSTIQAELSHPELAAAVPVPDTSMKVKITSDAFPTSLDPEPTVEQQEEGPPLKRQKPNDMQSREPNEVSTIGTAAS